VVNLINNQVFSIHGHSITNQNQGISAAAAFYVKTQTLTGIFM